MKIAIFGSGHFGQQALKEYGVDKVKYFVDNNQSKWGTKCQGKEIISFEKYQKIAKEYYTVVAVNDFQAIVKQLEDIGIYKYEIFNPYYKKQFNKIKGDVQGVKGNILLYGIDEKTEIVWNLLILAGISKDRILFSDTENNIKKINSFKGIEVCRIEDIIEQFDTVVVSAETRSYALQASLERKVKSKRILNMFILIHYVDGNRLVSNPYENIDHDTSEQEWIKQNDNERIRASIQWYMEELIKELPLFQHIEIETYNRCNGICSFCPVSIKNEKRPLMRMDEALFREIISQLEKVNYSGKLALFSNNEPFLDERIISFNQYARKRLPDARMHLFTNGTLLGLEEFIEIMNYLDEIVIDNYNQELKLIPPVKKIVEYCEEHPKLKKKVIVVMRKPGEILTNRGGDAPNRKKTDYMASCGCVMPFRQMIVRPDGKVSLCCNDPYGKYTMGDLSKESILSVWYGEKFEKVRKAMLAGRENFGECRYCDTAQLL